MCKQLKSQTLILMSLLDCVICLLYYRNSIEYKIQKVQSKESTAKYFNFFLVYTYLIIFLFMF